MSGRVICLAKANMTTGARFMSSARKPFHDLGYKMGDGYVAFWKHAHRTEPIVVYSVILAAMGPMFAYFGPKIWPLERMKNAQIEPGNKRMTGY